MAVNMNQVYAEWARNPTQKNMLALLAAAQPIINMAVRSYVGSQDPVAFSKAKLLAMQAIRNYDPGRKTQLRTHLLTQLQPLRRLAAKRRFVMHIPEQVQYDASGLRSAEAELQDELGREPTDAELADRTQLSLKRIQHLRKFQAAAPESAMGVEGPPTTLNTDPLQDWQDYVYYDLSPTDKKIFEWRTGYNGKKQLGVSDISKKLGLSAGAITQRANKIASKMEEGFKIGRPG